MDTRTHNPLVVAFEGIGDEGLSDDLLTRLHQGQITDETSFATDLGIDSLAMTEMAFALEERLPEQFGEPSGYCEVSEIKTVGELRIWCQRNKK